MLLRRRRRWSATATVLTVTGVMVVGLVATATGPASARTGREVRAAAVPAGLPAVKHIFQIQLENESESTTFGPGSPATFLNSLFPGGSNPVGVFLPNYYATTHNSLGNYLAQIAGVPGTSMGANNTVSDCDEYQDVTPAGGPFGQPSHLQGCVYPSSVPTIADQIQAAGMSWHGWMEDLGNTAQREATTCGEPAVAGTAVDPTTSPATDDTQKATLSDQYAARHNPFAYFHSLIDPVGGTTSPCNANVTSLAGSGAGTGLASTLTGPAGTAANYNFISPNLCDDGHDATCAGPGDAVGADGTVTTVAHPTGGLAAADAFLREWVPMIMASPSYQNDGLIAITFDEAGGGVLPPSQSCCGEVPGTTGIQPAGGGGQTGAVLISPLIAPRVDTTAYNHYSLLHSFEDLLDLPAHLGATAAIANTPSFGADVYAPAGPPAKPAGAAYTSLPPTRIADTRPGSNEPDAGQTLGAGKSLDIATTQTASGAPYGVPATATAVAVSVTAVNGGAPGFLSMFPTGGTQATTSVVNFGGGPTCHLDCVAPNLVILPLGTAQQLTVVNGAAGPVDVVMDLEGYFAPTPTPATASGAGHYTPLTPKRLADTRCGEMIPARTATCSAEALPQQNANLATVGPTSTTNVTVAGLAGVPADAAAAVV